ncbi:MAG: hypothetical protein IT300_14820 [Dehalococcoidia bacterium]|nr:hypothetical protein [Dehalococcoidia bacterium]
MRHRTLALLLLMTGLLPVAGSYVHASPTPKPPAALPTLSLWQTALLGRWIAIDGYVNASTRRYKIPTRWTTMAFASESVLNPLAKGSEPGDRGIGQVGFYTEEWTRAEATDPKHPNYNPDVKKHASIWNPQVNIALASISFKWVYSLKYVKSPADAYAVYTVGIHAINPDGSYVPKAQERVDRARSFRKLLATFSRLKRASRGMDQTELEAAIPDPLVRAILGIDHSSRDGEAVYSDLVSAYMVSVRENDSAWRTVILGGEALRFLDAGTRVYHEKNAEGYQALDRLLRSKRSLFRHEDQSLRDLYEQLLTDTAARVAGA